MSGPRQAGGQRTLDQRRQGGLQVLLGHVLGQVAHVQLVLGLRGRDAQLRAPGRRSATPARQAS